MTASNGTCIVNMTGTAYISLSPLPVVNAVSGGGGYCSGGLGAHVYLGGSQTGTSYHLFDGSTLVDTLLGTGSFLDFGLFTGAGTYTVTATNLSTTCTSNMTGVATIAVNPLPSVYIVTGGGSYCAGSTGVHGLGSPGPALGISYQLFTGGFPVEPALPSTLFPIDFGAEDSRHLELVFGYEYYHLVYQLYVG